MPYSGLPGAFDADSRPAKYHECMPNSFPIIFAQRKSKIKLRFCYEFRSIRPPVLLSNSMCESRPVMMAHSRAPENRTNGLTGGARRWGMAHVVSHRGTKSASKQAKIQTSMSLFFPLRSAGRASPTKRKVHHTAVLLD